MDVLVGLRAVLDSVLDAGRAQAAALAAAAELDGLRAQAHEVRATLSGLLEVQGTAWAQSAALQGAAADAARSALVTAESTRRAARTTQRLEDEDSADRRLRNALRSVQGEGRLWASQEGAIRWKLDREEDPQRRRRRLRRDWKQARQGRKDKGPPHV